MYVCMFVCVFACRFVQGLVTRRVHPDRRAGGSRLGCPALRPQISEKRWTLQIVPQRCLNEALRRLSWEVGRYPVHSARHGGQRWQCLPSRLVLGTRILRSIGPLRLRCPSQPHRSRAGGDADGNRCPSCPITRSTRFQFIIGWVGWWRPARTLSPAVTDFGKLAGLAK